MPKVADSYLEARKRSILEAATRVFSRKGVQSATMADIAKEADISPGAIYRYFDSKEALAMGCFDDTARAVTDQWLHRPESSPHPLADFADLARETLRLVERPAHALDTILDLEAIIHAFRDDPERMDEIREANNEVRLGVQARVEAAQRAGEISPDLDTEMLARALLSFYWGLRIARLQDQQAPLVPQFEALLSLMEQSAPKA